jgi:hypothetical protein
MIVLPLTLFRPDILQVVSLKSKCDSVMSTDAVITQKDHACSKSLRSDEFVGKQCERALRTTLIYHESLLFLVI